MTIERVNAAKPSRWTTWLGLILVPVLVLGGLLWATWSSDQRLDTVRAAVVNQDEAVELAGQIVPMGRQLTAALVDSDRVQNLAWEQATLDGAFIRLLPEEDRGLYNTLSGLLMMLLGRMPHTTDLIELAGWRFEIIDMDDRRIDKLLFRQVVKPEDEAKAVADRIEKDFLQDGGVVTTLTETEQQWDWPNGWAPMQWVTIQGLREYGFHALADKVRAN